LWNLHRARQAVTPGRAVDVTQTGGALSPASEANGFADGGDEGVMVIQFLRSDVYAERHVAVIAAAGADLLDHRDSRIATAGDPFKVVRRHGEDEDEVIAGLRDDEVLPPAVYGRNSVAVLHGPLGQP